MQTYAKVARPTLPPVFPRERLFTTIDDLRRHPVTWVSGPAGCGKTTLIASYLEARRLPCLWYQMDVGDADAATFFYYMGIAARKAAPRKTKPLPLLTPECLPSLNTFTLRWFENLYSRLKEGCAIILDNYQEIPPDSILHEVLRYGLSVVPAGISVMLISRRQPPQELSRLLANNAMGFLGWNNIRLTKEETEGIALLHFGKEMPPDVINQLHTATGGWAAGLVLLSEYAKREPIEASGFANRTPEELFEYFASEVFENAEPGIQDFLLTTSILPRMTVRLAENLTRSSQAGKILSNLNRNHYFTDRRLGFETTYQYHPLFREFLRARARTAYSSRRMIQLKRAAAKLFEADGQIEDAFSLCRESGDVPAMTRLIIEHTQTLLLQGRNQTLEHWFAALPPDVLDEDPWLLYWCGASRMYGNPLESKALYEKALALFEKQRKQTGTLLAFCGVFEAITYGLGQYKTFDEWIPRLNEFFKKIWPLPSPDLEIKVTLSLLSALVLRQPNHPDMKFWEKKALSFLQSDSELDVGAKVHLTSILAYNRINSGDLRDAQVLLDTYGGRAEAHGIPPGLSTLLADIKALCYWTSGEFEACQRVVARGLKLASDTGVYLFAPLLCWQGASAALSVGDMNQAEAFMKGFEINREQQGAYQTASFYFVIAWKHLLLKEYVQALFNAELSVRLAEEGGSPVPLADSRLGYALALHASGRHDEAFEQVAQSLAMCGQTRALMTEFSCHLAQAEFFLDLGDEDAAATSLRTAMPLGRKQGYINVWLWRPEVMARLCGKALELGIEVDYVRDLIKRRGLVPEQTPLHLESWPWPLKIYTLGSFKLLRDDQPIRFSHKAQRRPLAMLQAIIAFGAREVREEALTDALWPEADGDLAHQSYATTLHRLRRLFDLPQAILRRENRITVNPLSVWVDLWVFEGLLDKADDAWDGCIQDEEYLDAIESTQKAIELYDGPFLATEGSPSWCIPVRERVRSRFLRAVRRVGEYLEKKEQWERAADWYERALEKDVLIEEFYQHLMSCYHQLDHRDQALLVYERCCATLSAVQETSPSPETIALKRRLFPG